MNLTLTDKKKEAGDAISFHFSYEESLSWRAGQFLHYSLPHENPDNRGTERWFTIAAAPHERRVQLTTRMEANPQSTFKKKLGALPIGGTIEADSPAGEFVVEDPQKDYIFIAGGIGITPFRSILLDLHFRKEPINVMLLYANRTKDCVFQNELEGISRRKPSLRIHYFIDSNHIDENAIRARVLNLQKPLFYISGPEPMVQSFEKMLWGMNIPEALTVRDYFPGYTWP